MNCAVNCTYMLPFTEYCDAMYVSCQTLLNDYHLIHAYSLNSTYAITH